MIACLGKTKGMDLEANPEEMQSGVEHKRVSKEHTTVKPVGGLRKRLRGQNLAAECHQKPKAWTWGKCGSQKLLAAACRRTIHRVKVAWRKGNVVQKNQTRDKTRRVTLKRGTFGMRHQPKPERKNGIRNQGLIQQL
jgi:hypothetical protein